MPFPTPKPGSVSQIKKVKRQEGVYIKSLETYQNSECHTEDFSSHNRISICISHTTPTDHQQTIDNSFSCLPDTATLIILSG